MIQEGVRFQDNVDKTDQPIHIEGKGRSINARAMKMVQVYVISAFIPEAFM